MSLGELPVEHVGDHAAAKIRRPAFNRISAYRAAPASVSGGNWGRQRRKGQNASNGIILQAAMWRYRLGLLPMDRDALNG